MTRITPSTVADLTLRFGDRRLRGRVYWPPALGAHAALAVLLAGTGTADDTENADLLSRGLSSAGYVVLAVPAGSERSYEMAALGWAAEHAPELGACSDRLVVGGHQGGGARAALLAIRARDEGWPLLRRQLLVHPTFTAACPVPSTISGVVPATVVASGEPHDDGSRFAARLRRETIPVEELRYPRGALRGNEEAWARPLPSPETRISTTNSHPWWTDKRGPVTAPARRIALADQRSGRAARLECRGSQ